MSANDFNKNDFINFWGPDGYKENFSNYEKWKYTISDVVDVCINPYSKKDGIVLELGSGGGVWTKYLIKYFSKCICVDVIPKPKNFEIVEYIELGNKDYKCSGVENNSIDFVWSFGLFCHLSFEAKLEYLKNIKSKMKLNACGVIMFANADKYWPDVSDLSSLKKDELIHMNNNGWFYDNPTITTELFLQSGFKNFIQLMPDFRDSLFYFKNDSD